MNWKVERATVQSGDTKQLDVAKPKGWVPPMLMEGTITDSDRPTFGTLENVFFFNSLIFCSSLKFFKVAPEG